MVELHRFGPKASKRLVIYVHGFAVNWRSKGLFSDLAQALKERGLTSILFDLSDYDPEDNASYLALNQQQERLKQVIKQLAKSDPEAKLSIIGHSLGCGLVASLGDDLPANLDKVLLLAPASDRPGPRIKAHLLEREGTTTQSGQITLIRANGKRNIVPEAYSQQLDIDFNHLYQKQWPNLKSLKIILAEQDNYQPQAQQLFSNYQAETIPGADHNFSKDFRAPLLELASSYLD